MMPAAPPSRDDLGAVFTALRGSLRNYLRRRVGDGAVAEDLMQDLFVKAMVAISANRAPGNLAGWLYAAARTTVADYYRATPRIAAALDDELPDLPSADEQALHQALATCIKPLALELAPIYRDTLLAADFEGRSLRAIAAEQGLSESAVKSRASRARSMLRDRLLACCHVEIANGAISDYHRRAGGRCGGGCT